MFHVRVLKESDLDSVIEAAGGIRAHPDSDLLPHENADYAHADAVIELKFIEEEGLDKFGRQKKIANLFERTQPDRPVVILDRDLLSEHQQNDYDRILESPIKSAVKKASKQLVRTRLTYPSTTKSVLFIVNNGYGSLDHADIVRMAERRVRNDTEKIDGIVVGGVYIFTDGMETFFYCPIEYVDIRGDGTYQGFESLKFAWDKFVEKLVTEAILRTSDLDAPKPAVVDTQFTLHDKTFVRPAPPLGWKSSFYLDDRPRKHDEPDEQYRFVAIAFPELTPEEWIRLRDHISGKSRAFESYEEWTSIRSEALAAATPLQPLVEMKVSLDTWLHWCDENSSIPNESSVFRFATALFNSACRQIEVLDKTNLSILPPRYILVVTEKIGQDASNDISHVVEVRETIHESQGMR